MSSDSRAVTPDLAASPSELLRLFREYVACAAPPGPFRDRLDAWAPIRSTAHRCWESLLEAERFAQDLDDAALWKLLPYESTPLAQRHAAFVHPLAPAAGDNLRHSLENAGRVRREQWADLGRGLFELVRRSTEHSSELWQAVEAFLALPGSAAFTCEMVSPILHALRPSEFVLLDAPARTVINHVSGSSYSSSLRDYPAAHVAARRLLADLRPLLAESALCDRRPEDVFEGFCHWFVHVRMAQSEWAGSDELPDTPPGTEPPAEAQRDAKTATPGVSLEMPPSPPIATPEIVLIEPVPPEPEVSRPVAMPELATPGEAPCEGPTAAAEPEPAPAIASAVAPVLAPAPEPAPTPPPVVDVVVPDVVPPARPVVETASAVVAPAPEPVAAQPFEPVSHVAPAAPAAEPDVAPAPARVARCTLLERAHAALQRRGQLVLAGSPGSGRSHLARRLAEELVAQGDGVLEHLVFHGAWRYADFVQQVRADGSRHPGRFLAFCRQAAARRGPSVLLIDDAERAELADVFGEALALLDARGREVTLAGGGSLLVPPNVRLVLTLDGGGRSGRAALAQLLPTCAVLRVHGDEDELRRRHPDAPFVEALLDLRRAIGAELGDPERSLPLAFFLRAALPGQLPDVWRTEVEPFLLEELAGEPSRAAAFRWEAVAARLGFAEHAPPS